MSTSLSLIRDGTWLIFNKSTLPTPFSHFQTARQICIQDFNHYLTYAADDGRVKKCCALIVSETKY